MNINPLIHDQIIQDISTQGWSFQQNVVDKNDLKLISSLFVSDFTPARIGKNQNLQRLDDIRGDFIRWIDLHHPLPELAPLLEFLNELKQRLNEHFFLGLKEFECHLAKYPKGTFYKKHLDRFNSDSSRSISFVFYLHEEWSEKDGGEIVFYRENGEVLHTLLPQPGSFSCFLSGDFPHEVKVCHNERRSLTGWMHTKIIS
jgi:SM-20-related protein